MQAEIQNKLGRSSFSGSLLWLGASISLAEILTGILISPLGLSTGIFIIIIGHLIGCILLFLTGIIGGKLAYNSMNVMALSFGVNGSKLFAFLNVLQLLGWSAVMIKSGAQALNSVSIPLWHYDNISLWSIVLGLVIITWLLIGSHRLWILNLIAVTSLLLAIFFIASKLDFSSMLAQKTSLDKISFGSALELSIMMPLSWLPLICDYTKSAKKPVQYTLFATGSYFLGSVCMYIIGLSFAIYFGSFDIDSFLNVLQLGVAILIVILLSTVTTTYLDVYSAAESFTSIFTIKKLTNIKLCQKILSLVITILGTLIAIMVTTSSYESFLYLIGSVFAPATAIILTDYFILKTKSDKKIDWSNIFIWILGVFLYNFLIQQDLIFGSTIPVFCVVIIASIAIKKAFVNPLNPQLK